MDVGLLFIVTWDSLCDLYPRLQMQLKELQEKPCVSSGSKPDVGKLGMVHCREVTDTGVTNIIQYLSHNGKCARGNTRVRMIRTSPVAMATLTQVPAGP